MADHKAKKTFAKQIEQEDGEVWTAYVKRVTELSKDSTVNELKSTLTKLGFKEKFTYMRKDALIEALISIQKETFVEA